MGRSGDDHGAVALADAASATHQRVAALHIRIGVKADGGDVEERFVLGAAVQGLDVAKGVREPVAGDANLVGSQAVKHEGIVRVRTMCNGDIDDWS